MFRRDGSVKRAPIFWPAKAEKDGRVVKGDWVAVGNGGRSAPSTAP